MSNISLMNTETSINFDGNGIQSRAEAEYRKEEERQQNELKGLLKDAFDDLVDDDLLSVTSEDSANISGYSESKTPLKSNGGSGDNAMSGLPSRDQVARELDAMANGMQHATFGVKYDVDNPVAKSQPSNVYHPGNYTTNTTASVDSNHDRQQHPDATNRYHGNQPIPDSEVYHLTNEHLHQHNHHNDQWHGNAAGYGHSSEHDQIHHPQLHHFHYDDPQYDEFYSNRFENNRLIEGREREEAEGGNDIIFDDTQGPTQWSQGHTHNIGYGQIVEVQGSNSVLPTHSNAYSHERGDYEMKGGNSVIPSHNTAYSHERGEYEVKGGNSVIPSHNTAYSHEREEYEIPRSEGHYVQPTQMHNMHGFSEDSFQRPVNSDSTEDPNRLNVPTSHSSVPASHFISAEPLTEMVGHNPHVHSDFQDNYKVQYRHTKTGIDEANTKLQNENLNNQGLQRTEDPQKEFISQDIGDGGQLTQLQILYKARGRKLEELTNLLENYKQEHGRELRIIKHQLSMAQAEKEGVETSYKQCQELLQDSKGENSTLTGKLRAAELQINSLKDVKEDLVKQIQTTESTIESLTQQVSDLSQSDSLSRARNDHDAVISSIQQRHNQEVLALKQSLDSAHDKLSEQESIISSLKRQLAEQMQLLEQAQISRAENINRLTKSLEESQRQCQALLESSSSQELSQIKAQLNQASASKRISDEMCTSLQSEIQELKDQLSMYESASSLGVFSRGQSMGTNDDSMVELGIKKTLDFNTPDSNSRYSRTHGSGEITSRLKNELERCVTSNSQKRAVISKLKEELRVAKEEIVTLKERCQRAEKNAEEYQKKLKEFEELLQPGNKMSAMEARMNKEIDNLKNERTILLEDIEELKKRLSEVAKSEETLSEINQELNKRMSDMVKEYDTDKREALERCQRASDQVHEVTKQNLRQQLMSEFSIERAQIVTRYESEIGQLRSELSSAQQEIDEVKDMYVKACSENNLLSEKLQGEFQDKHKEELEKIKEELTSEKEKEVEKVRSEITDSLRDEIKEEVKNEYEATVNREVESEVARLKLEWMEEMKQSKDLAVENAINSAKNEWTSKYEETLESEVNKRVEAAKSKWLAEKQLSSYSELQTEKAKWQTAADDRLEEEVKKAVNHARSEWETSAAETEKSKTERSNLQEEELEGRMKERVNEEVEKRLAKEKTTWQLEADIKLEKEIRHQIKMERTRWQLEHDHEIEVEVELALKRAKKKWSTTAEEQKKISEEDHKEILENEKLRWQRESSVTLKEEVRKAVEACERDLEKRFQERQTQDEKRFQEKQMQDELRFQEKLEVEKERWMQEADGKLQEEVRRIVEQEQIAASAMEQTVTREEMNVRIQSEVANAVENAKLEWEKHLDVTRSLLEQELQGIKSENSRLKVELHLKECEWVEKRDALITQKDSERRQRVKEVHDQCQQEYQKFISDHQDTLNQTLKDVRDKHALEKMKLQLRYDEKIEELQSEKQQLLHELRNRETNHDNSLQETSVPNVSLDIERQVWQKERQKLKKSVATREKLLKSADSHMASELDKLKAELEDAYQAQLAAEMVGVEEERERLLNEVSDKQKYIHQLEEEVQLLRTKMAELEMSHKQEILSLKQKQQELNSQCKKTEKLLQDAQNRYHRELKTAEAESKETMENMKKKMIEMRNSHAAAIEALKKQHGHEKRELIKQLKKYTDRTLVSIAVQTENWDELQLLELRGQYIETVKKIKEDVMQHTTLTNLRAAETVKESVSKERLVTVKQLKNFYKNSIRKILQNELTSADLENKLASIDQALEQLTISLCSTPSVTPRDAGSEKYDQSGKTSVTSGSILTPRSIYSYTGSETSSLEEETRPEIPELYPKSVSSNNADYTSSSFQPMRIDMTDSLDESRPSRRSSQGGLTRDSPSDLVAVQRRPPRHSNNDVVQLTDSPNSVVSLRPRPTRQPRNNGDGNKMMQRNTFEESQFSSVPFGQMSDGSAFSKNHPSAKELRLDLATNRVLTEERFTKPPLSSRSPTFGTNKKVSSEISQVTKSMEEDFLTPKLTTFQPKLFKAKSEMTLNKFGGSTGFSTAGIQINYTYTPLNQSLNNASPSTSLLSTCSLSDGDLRLVGQHLPVLAENGGKDEPVLLNLQSLGLGNPSPRKFNPAPERLQDRYHSVRSSDGEFNILSQTHKSNTDRAQSSNKQRSVNQFKEFPGKNKMQFGLVSISNEFTDNIGEQSSRGSGVSHRKSLQDLTSFSMSSPKEERTFNKINKVLHFSEMTDHFDDMSSITSHRSFRTVEPDSRVFPGKQVHPQHHYRESNKGRRSYDDVYPRDKSAGQARTVQHITSPPSNDTDREIH
ncbi:centrosomal protein of 152 kDa-like [Gigantopelta aegis]|uniref:centrosomal protein of 152 kDa-like n=1 Tax=Gigantopelta aegis TaxID=1735272 RepID=UPI001B88946B|nr:centrosomal protein of 152 kDa-like [Gigantopelta aegis]